MGCNYVLVTVPYSPFKLWVNRLSKVLLRHARATKCLHQGWETLLTLN